MKPKLHGKYLQMPSNTFAPPGIEPGPFGTLTDDATHLAVAAVKIRNELPVTVCLATSTHQFAQRLKTQLFSLYFG